MLDDYYHQDMFSVPVPLPKEGKFNVLPMIWDYLIKPKTLKRKARCVANGYPRQKGSIILANTFAACLEQPAARLFYGTCALRNYIIYGLDCSNAFAEAPPPVAPLYLKIDQQFRD